MSSNKQKIINHVYCDRSRFRSRATTPKDAREKDKSITKEDVKKVFGRMLERRVNPEGRTVCSTQRAF